MGEKRKGGKKKRSSSKVKAKSPSRTKSLRPSPSSSSPTKTESASITEVVRATSDVAEFAAKGSRNFVKGLWDDFASSIVSHSRALLRLSASLNFLKGVVYRESLTCPSETERMLHKSPNRSRKATTARFCRSPSLTNSSTLYHR